MSRIGKLPIELPSGVTVEITGTNVSIKGPKGELSHNLPESISIEQIDNALVLVRVDESTEARSLHGLSRSLVDNMVVGVSKGFEKQLELVGVGYRAALQGKKLSLSLGYSHPVVYSIPEGIEVTQDKDKQSILTVTGIDKQKVGQVAAEIREYRKPEPYKGKGIRYVGEYVRRKAGKTSSS
ncbi:50S ribosomal protein L6 [Candidatus Peregrinibacteria bacterium CG11_big_fil_rev_8_21_14_0_20_41_10]|nr:MAG: 50S ribosomal protein L6 [Candidatus Peregrinibacteria bacterium CG11_big_fil_rev_8_21_14_0_20_41_10]PIZ76773.1 MAG: 50S ribosomal protein L6 [Candidatus Peregrinibacteria bacterium CG_4_10_14_0_2_um_filter_41_8]PJC37976.1 MAG: 50S ribosomal protein L6 [Candidatus Peregrinibacteria bacterium CG_4_9_14_0_2_um_filter_41_14]